MKRIYNITFLALLFTSTVEAEVFSKTGDYVAKEREKGCEYTIYTMQPNYPYYEVGLIEFGGSFIAGKGGGPDTIKKVKKHADKHVCKNGGNGLLVWAASGLGVYKKATVIYVDKTKKM